MLSRYKVRITVVKKTFNQELADAYTEGEPWKPAGCCHAFDVGHEWISDGHMPEGFSDWAWTDIQKYVMVLAGAVASASVIMVVGLAAAADEAPRGGWTEAQTARGYVVFSHSTLERLGAEHVPSRDAIVEKVSCALARNEYESLQIGVHAIGADLTNVRLEVQSDLQVSVYHGGGGEVDDQGNRKQPAKATGIVSEPPEVVLHDGGLVRRLAAGKSVNYWLTFHASEQTPGGVHEGKLRIETDGREATVLGLTIRVRPFVLHRPRISIGIYYPQGRGWVNDQWWTSICTDMAEHGQTAIALYDYAPISQTISDGQGVLRALRVAGTTGLMHPDVPWLWLYGGGWDTVEDGKKIPATQASKTRTVNWLRDECRRNGLPEMVLYGWDEPPYPWPALRRHFRPWRDIPIRVGTAMSAQATYGHSDMHDVWVVHCPVLTPQMWAEAARMDAQVWMYSCQIRSWQLLRERYLTGIFTWSNKLMGSYLWAGPGYTQHWWPPGGGGPMPTAGWETRREGVDDYRYFQMLEDCIEAGPERMLAVEAAAWLEAVRQRCTMDPHQVKAGTPLALEGYDTIRARAADYIERLGAVSDSGLEPPPVTSLKDEAKDFRDRSLEQCIAALTSFDVWRRRSAAWSLFERGVEAAPATSALMGVLNQPEVRMVALHALEAIGPDAHTAVPGVAALLAHDDAFVRIGATHVLGAIGAFAAEDPGRGRPPPPDPAPTAPLVVEPLRVALQDDCPDVAFIAAQMLRRLGPAAAPALPEAIRLLHHDEWKFREAGLGVIAGLGSKGAGAVPRIVELYVSKSHGKGWAHTEAEVLAAIGPAAAAAVPTLEQYPSRQTMYRPYADYALYRIRGDANDIERLLDGMSEASVPESHKRNIVEMLNAMGATAAPAVSRVRQMLEQEAFAPHRERLELFLRKVERGEGFTPVLF